MNIDGWNFRVWEANAGDLRCKIASPAGRIGYAGMIGFDSRLTNHRTSANIQFKSSQIRLSEALIDRMILAFRAYAEEQKKIDPEFYLDAI